jgi:hypothetical protein
MIDRKSNSKKAKHSASSHWSSSFPFLFFQRGIIGNDVREREGIESSLLDKGRVLFDRKTTRVENSPFFHMSKFDSTWGEFMKIFEMGTCLFLAMSVIFWEK